MGDVPQNDDGLPIPDEAEEEGSSVNMESTSFRVNIESLEAEAVQTSNSCPDFLRIRKPHTSPT